jgi:hypothetical protein
MDTIIDVNSLKFKQDFITGTLPDCDFFYQTFEEALIEVGNRKFSSQQKMSQIENKFRNIFNRTVDQSNLTRNQNESDDAINQFLNKLLYVTNLKTKDLQNQINLNLGKTFKQGDIKIISVIVENRVKDFFMGGKYKELTRKDFDKILSEIASEEVNKWKDESFKTILYFKSIQQGVTDFLKNTDANQPRILRVQSSKEETHFAAMRVLSNFPGLLIYLNSNFNKEDFEQGIIFFENLESYKLLLIELYEDTLQVFKDHEAKLESILQHDPSKKLVLIGDAKLQVNFQNIQTLNENESCLTDLADDSKDEILDEKIQFQNQETTWREVLDGHDLDALEIPLKEIWKSRQLGNEVKVSKSYSEKIYIPRTVLYSNRLKSTILTGGAGVFVFDKKDFEQKRQNGTSCHLLQKLDNQLEWLESNKDLTIILKNIEGINSKNSREEQLTKTTSRLTMI